MLSAVRNILLIFALMASLAGCYTIYGVTPAKNTTPLNVPISIKSGVIQASFTTEQDANYEIYIYFEKNIPFEELNCLTANPSFSKTKCAEMPSALIIDWDITENGRRAFSGAFRQGSAGGYGTNAIWRYIGSFKALPGHVYALDLHVKTDSPRLDLCRPRLMVRGRSLK